MTDFIGLEIDVAIRLFLSRVDLPDEAQKIDRTVEKFAEIFFSKAPVGLFANSDEVFVLAFTAIMLSSDVHNSRITEDKKMTRDQFSRNTRGVNDAGDLPVECLAAVYDQIKAEPLWTQSTDEGTSTYCVIH